MRITDKMRLDWLLDNRDMGVRSREFIGIDWLNNRKEIDAAMVRSRRAKPRSEGKMGGKK